MNLFLPKQHGAWAMLIIPFWLGVAATELLWQHIPFFGGWLFLYLATYPMLLLFKGKKLKYYTKWSIYYLVPSLLFLLLPLLYEPKLLYFGALMIPFFIVNAYYSSKNRDRALINDISAIIAFSLAGVGSGFIVSGTIHTGLILVFICSTLFFLGSTFYVKSMIRERKNSHFKWISWIYHLIVVMVWLVLGEWYILLAFMPSFLRSIVFYGRPLSAKQVGIYEIVNSMIFFLFVLLRLL
jgi:hypothetical protein